jgi:hypothetical protein
VLRCCKQTYPDVCKQRLSDIEGAARAALRSYNNNVFKDLKVAWGTYPNNLGHTDFPWCCHEMIAVDEPAPEVLKAPGLLQAK